MKMTSSGSEIGIPDLEEHLPKYIERVRGGEEIVVTDDGRPVARLSPIDGPRNRLAELVAAGVVRAPTQVSDLFRGAAPGERW
jgi:prevent-host-death family protein